MEMHQLYALTIFDYSGSVDYKVRNVMKMIRIKEVSYYVGPDQKLSYRYLQDVTDDSIITTAKKKQDCQVIERVLWAVNRITITEDRLIFMDRFVFDRNIDRILRSRHINQYRFYKALARSYEELSESLGI